MEYIYGIVGIVLIGSIFCGILYAFFLRTNSLDDVNANMREDRRFGNYNIEDYDDDDRVEAFEDIIGIADEIRDMEFEEATSDINKFIARRSNQNNKDVDETNNIQTTGAQPVQQAVMVNPNTNDVEEL